MEIIYSKYFVKRYKKLPQNIQKKFKERLGLFIGDDDDNSLLNIHSLRGEFTGKYSFNVNADYRVIYDYNKNDEIAVLIDIGTHSESYS